jgi:hypothetical protein
VTTLPLTAGSAAEVWSPKATEQRNRRRLGLVIWALLFFSGAAFNPMPLLIPIPPMLGKLATQSALGLALLLLLALNPRLLTRPNLFLTLFTLLAASALMVSVRMSTGIGMLFRAGRFAVFIGALWLLTPLWGRRDLLLLRWHMTCLAGALATVVAGFAIAPGRARQFDGRLAGQIWPIPPTQVGHYAAVLAGLTFVLTVSGLIRVRPGVGLVVGAVAVLLLSHTRTATIALVIAALCATATLITIRRRARHVLIVAGVALLLVLTVLAPAVSQWYSRGQSAQTVGQLNGRKMVWDGLVKQPRSVLTETFGMGLTNNSFGGLPIDNSWYATYQDQGLFGVAICGFVLLSLLMIATTRARSPAVAAAVFLVVYCAIASWTEVGLGQAGPYVLDLTVAAALLAAPAASSKMMQDTR